MDVPLCCGEQRCKHRFNVSRGCFKGFARYNKQPRIQLGEVQVCIQAFRFSITPFCVLAGWLPLFIPFLSPWPSCILLSGHPIHPLPFFFFLISQWNVKEVSLRQQHSQDGTSLLLERCARPVSPAALISARGRGNKDGHASTAPRNKERTILQNSVAAGKQKLVWDRVFKAGFGALHNLHPTVHRLNPFASWEGVLSIVTVRMDYILCILSCFMPHVIK